MNLYDLYFKNFINNNKLYIICYIILTCILLISESIVGPILYSKIILALNLKNFNNIFYKIFLYLCIIWIFIFILYYIKYNIEKQLLPLYVQDLRDNLINLTFEKYKNNLIDIKIGDHIMRLMRVSVELSDGLYEFCGILLPSILGLLIICLYLFIININIGSFLLLGFIIYIIIIIVFSLKIIEISNERENFYFKNIDKLHSKFTNLINIYLNNQKDIEIDNSKNDQNNYKKIMSNQMNETNKLIIYLQIISIIWFLITIYISYYYYKINLLEKQNFILILIILTYFITLSLKFSNVFPMFIIRLGVAKNSFNYFNNLSNIDNTIIKYNNINSGSIKIINLSFFYPSNKNKKYIFNNLNYEFKSGERIAILGSSGSGKSTLAKLIMNLYKYDGDIYIDDKNIKYIDDNILRKNIIYVNQKTGLFEDTIFENIKYGNNISNDDIINIINKYELSNIFNGLNQNYNTNCGVNGNNLSLGMQKIIILLRAYFKIIYAKIIIFDEPLSGLDQYSRNKILNLIKDINKDKTIIIITHDTEILSIVNKNINIDNIKIDS